MESQSPKEVSSCAADSDTHRVHLTRFPIATRHFRTRLKVLSGISACVEDVADIEGTHARSIGKLAHTALNQSNKGVNWMPGLAYVLEHILKLAITHKSEQHLAISVTVTQSICKGFQNMSKDCNKRINSSRAKVSDALDAYRKSRSNLGRLQERYGKLVQEIESNIRSREDMHIDSEKKESSGSADAKDQSFVQQSLQKMKIMTKTTPEDIHKRITEKVRDQIKELDSLELQVTTTMQQTASNQVALKQLLRKAIDDVNNLEGCRLEFLQESLVRLYLTEDLMIEKFQDFTEACLKDIDSLNIEKEVSNMLWTVDQPHDNSGSEGDDEDDDAFDEMFSRVDRLIDAMEFVETLVECTNTHFDDLIEADEAYARNCAKVMEKHGFGTLQLDAVRSVQDGGPEDDHSEGNGSVVKNDEDKTVVRSGSFKIRKLSGADLCADLLKEVESPSTSTGWTLVLGAFKKIGTLHSMTAHRLKVEVCKPLELKMSELKDTRKKLIDKTNAIQKAVDEAIDEVTKLDQKLAKLKAHIEERKITVRKARGEDENVKLTSVMKNGIETRQQRVARIENQILELEEEEQGVQDSLTAAKNVMLAVKHTNRLEILGVLNVTKEVLCNEITSLKKTVLANFAKWEREALDLFRNAIDLVRQRCHDIDVGGDLDQFIAAYASESMGEKPDAGDVVNDDLVQLPAFVPSRVESIETERKAQNLPEAPTASESTAIDGNPDGVEVELFAVVEKYQGGAREQANSTELGSEASSPRAATITRKDLSAMSGSDDSGVIRTPSKSDDRNEGTSDRQTSPGCDSVSPKGEKSPNGEAPDSSVRDRSGSRARYGSPLDKKEDTELVKFGLSSVDRVLESFSCALYPKKSIGLIHGRMYVTQHYIAFQGWPDTRVLLPLGRLASIEKMNTLYYIPNAILIKYQNEEEFFFGSFIDRDRSYTLLMSMSQVEKRLLEMNGDLISEHRVLVFGLQKNAVSDYIERFSEKQGNSEAMAAAQAAKEVLGVSAEELPTQADLIAVSHDFQDHADTSAHFSDTLSDGQITPLLSSPTRGGIAASTSEARGALVTSAPPRKMSAGDEPDEADDGVAMAKLFSTIGVTSLAKGDLSVPVHHVWKACWLRASGYGDFLDDEGDLEIKTDEWQPFDGSVPEDIAKVKFTYARNVSYAHPRTTMLMFGPKNAPAKQVQYLYVHGRGSGLTSKDDRWSERIEGCKPRRGLVVAVTQFDGIPMCDTFKVLTYFSFNETSANPPRTAVEVGVHVHFIKSTMFKGKISSGVKDELVDLAEHYVAFADKRSHKFRRGSSVKLDPVSGVLVEETPDADTLNEKRVKGVAGDADAVELEIRGAVGSRRSSKQLSDADAMRLATRRPTGLIGAVNNIVIDYAGIILLLGIALLFAMQYMWYRALVYEMQASRDAAISASANTMKALENFLKESAHAKGFLKE